MGSLSKDFRRAPPLAAAGMLQQICGCKWSLTVYWLIANGVSRPGAMSRAVEGLTPKVLNDCLRRNVELGILERTVFAEVPPRVEYTVSDLGRNFLAVVAHLDTLQAAIDATASQMQSAALEGRR